MQLNSVIMTNSSITEQSFRINLRVMRAFQLYPPENHTPLYKIKAYFVHFVFVMYIPILGILYLLLEEHLNMERVNYNAAFLAQVTAFSAKFLPIINNAHRIKKCITFFESSSFNVTKAKHGNILNNCIQICRRNTRIFLVCVAVGVTNWATKPLFWEGRNFPTDVWLPFNATSHITVYCCFYIYLATGNMSDTLIDAIYMSEWYIYDVKSKKALITLMERSKQPITVAAGKLVELSLITFVTFSDLKKVLLTDSCNEKF
ncbi:uncharacterized protein [Tenebrio molitor]|uniref:uncharacterized protein n=1 Tax=Tenebrio molitor TaxID=7067 RepID=UPI00362494FD